MIALRQAGFAPGVLRGSMLPSDRLTLVERLFVDEDSGRLQIRWTANEPVYYSEPLTGSQELQSTDQEIMRYDCIPESH